MTRRDGRDLFHPEVQICTDQTACDGQRLQNNRIICGKCEDAKRRRAKKPAGLRGEHYLNYTESRKRA